MSLRALQGPTGGGAPVGGTGTIDTIPRWTGASTLGDSLLSQSGAIVTNSGTFRVANGSVSEPAYTFSGSSGTGMYRTTSGALLRFAVSGAYAFGVDTNGNVGIGTASPGSYDAGARNLVVGSGTGNQGITIAGGGNLNLYFATGTTGGDPYRGYIRYTAAGDAFTFATASTVRASLGGSSLDISSTAGYGLKLPATPGNPDTQTLDCYAEGTWTPTLAGFVTNTPGTIAASYTRIGRMVTLNVYLYAGGSSFGSTLGTTTVTVPSGMTPNFNGVGIGGLSRTTGTVAQAIAYYDGKIYLGTSASAATEMWVSVTYYV